MSDAPVKQVICISWGTKYGPHYVNRLHAMVARNITPPYTFTCFTDRPEGLADGIRTEPLPPLPCDMPTGVPGKWPKSRLWGATLGGLTGPVLFVDLDVVIVDSLDPFFSEGSPEDVILARNVAKPLHRLGQTSIYRFPVGKLKPIQDAFAADPQGVGAKYRYEQHYVTAAAPGGVRFWPKGWVRHFRIECIRTFPLNLFTEPRKPAGTRVVIFAGRLNPEDAVAGRWAPDEPSASTLRAHLARVWRTRGGFRGLRRFVRPTRWVAEAWRE
ncbi:glycosyl transferase [Jannaschia sp. Os4]|uniref:glycosyl transferase n=1 Tax=Jannaschia sp. Os4 TaxID=2807617 RepID=UPI001939EDD3|nr:glycosyl transferase [Jannaschia sp. Os4]MBM2575854.1 glycosyl transferase [Jannaschia sp. Os4]